MSARKLVASSDDMVALLAWHGSRRAAAAHLCRAVCVWAALGVREVTRSTRAVVATWRAREPRGQEAQRERPGAPCTATVASQRAPPPPPRARTCPACVAAAMGAPSQARGWVAEHGAAALRYARADYKVFALVGPQQVVIRQVEPDRGGPPVPRADRG
eukprot:2756342-Prymnesium_polylepis.1